MCNGREQQEYTGRRDPNEQETQEISMNRFILSIATAAIASATLIGGAQASTIWRFPHKSAPYAVPHDHVKSQGAAPVVVHRTARHNHG